MDAVLLDWLASAHTLTLGNGHVNFISFVVSMAVIEIYKSRQKAPVEWWRSFTVCCLWWFGGGSTVAMLTGEPIGWIRAPDVFLGFTLSWWLMLYCPGDSWFRVFVTPPVRTLVMVAEGVNSAINMITAVSMCLAHVTRTEVPATAKPSLFLACVVCAFLFDQAGGLIVYYCNLVDTPPSQAGMQYGIHRSLTLAVVYTAVVFDVFGLFGGPVSRGHIVFLLTLVSFLGDLMYYTTKRDVFTSLWSKLLHVVNIPLVVPAASVQEVAGKED